MFMDDNLVDECFMLATILYTEIELRNNLSKLHILSLD